MYSTFRVLILRLTKSLQNPPVRNARRNVGLEKRLRILPDDVKKDMEALENIDDLEADFMDIHKTHHEHVKEMELQKEKLQSYVVKHKYFKEIKLPNFLTWHDKQQIRYLHQTDPEEWTIEKLSEGFPALPAVIDKIVKGSWQKKNDVKIRSHDAAVQKNWAEFKSGKIANLPPALKNHLNKFTNRELNLRPFEKSSNQIEISREKSEPGEFLKIILSHQRQQNKPLVEQPQCNAIPQASLENSQNQTDNNDVYKSEKITKRKNFVTLSQLQDSVKNKFTEGKALNEEEKVILWKMCEKEDSHVMELPRALADEVVALGKNKYKSSSTSLNNYVKKPKQDLSHLEYPEQIRIPKKIVRKDKVYKLNDCFYDYDGQFLYRVPGMDD